MFSLYNLFKFVHIAAAIVWLGGVLTLGILNARLAREQDSAALRLLSRQGAFFGRAVAGPAALLTVLAGFAMMGVSQSAFAFWTLWGLAAVIVSIALGATVIRRSNEQLTELATRVGADDERLLRVRRRLAVAATINLVLLFSTVAAMVFKPTL